MSFTIYGKPNCSGCQQAKQLLEQNNIEYIYLSFGKDFDMLKLFDVAPNTRSFPVIFDGDTLIGGLVELKEVLVNQAH